MWQAHQAPKALQALIPEILNAPLCGRRAALEALGRGSDTDSPLEL